MRHIELGSIIAPAKARRAGNINYPVLSITMRDGLVNQADKFKKRIASADTSPYKVVERNQLVVGFPIDEGVLAFQRLYDEAIVSPAYNIWNLHDDTSMDHGFLERFLRSPRALAFYRSKLRSTTARRRTLPNDVFLSLAVPMPPLAEQKRIVRLLDNADELRKLRAQADRCTAAILPALFCEMFGDPVVNQRGWPIVRLDAIGHWTSGGTPPRSNPQYFTGDIDWYSAGELNSLYLPPSQEKITQAAIEETSAKFFPKGSMLVGMYDTAAFKMGILTKGASSNQACANVSLNLELCVSEWLYVNFLLMKEHFLRQRRGVRQQNLSLAMIKAFEIPLPPLSLQNEFCRRVGEVRDLEASQAVSRQRIDDLFKSVLDRAFKGDL